MLTKRLWIVLVVLATACSSRSEAPSDVGGSDATELDGADGQDDDAAPEDATDATPDAVEAGPDADDGTPDPGDETAPDGAEADAAEAAPEGSEPAPEVVDALPEADVEPPTCEPTASDVQGPYYVAGAPWTTELAGPDEPGQRLALSGSVRGPGCEPLPGAVLDVWQADATGTYDETPGSWRLRGRLTADADGRWSLTTIVPGRYLQASGYRPAHIHFKVSADGHVPLTTQLYFAGDPYLHPNDSCTSCGSDEPTLIIPLTEGTGGAAGTSTGVWNVVLGSGEN